MTAGADREPFADELLERDPARPFRRRPRTSPTSVAFPRLRHAGYVTGQVLNVDGGMVMA